MNNPVSKTAILPVVSVAFVAVEALSGHKITAVSPDEIANGIAILATAVIGIWGIFKNHKQN